MSLEQVPSESAAESFRYLGSRIPRRVEREEAGGTCRHLAGPVQIVRGLSDPERQEFEKAKPGYLVVAFEGVDSRDSRNLDDAAAAD